MHYKLRFDRTKYLAADISLDEIKAKMGDYFALDTPSWKEVWAPPELTFTDDSDQKTAKTLPDITCWFTDELILSDKAYSLIHKQIRNCGEFLPATYDGETYWVLHVTTVIDSNAIDITNSSRTTEEDGYVQVDSLQFKQSYQYPILFKTEYTDYRNIYCTDKFKQLVESHNLNGLVFSGDLSSIL